MKNLILIFTLLVSFTGISQSLIAGGGIDSNSNGFTTFGAKGENIILKMKDGVGYTTFDFAAHTELFENEKHSFDIYAGTSIINSEKYSNNYMRIMLGGMFDIEITKRVRLLILSESYLLSKYTMDFNLSGIIQFKL